MNEIFKIKPFPGAALLFMAFALLSGTLIIFTFNNELFFRLSFFQLIVLSISGTSPLIVLNSYLSYLFIDKEVNETFENDEFVKIFTAALLIGSLLTLESIYLSLFLEFILEKTFTSFIISIIFFEFGTWSSFLIDKIWKRKK